ncbi:hypothetical protein AMS68_003066 [Peltaster fructicola]|uniref:SPRY domain-containing protein n=1 Tax=Peltaster fructicola TaxID=286661 RepID=A0A6H0XSF1_9PEZI|nr:hypothetical protein AMS68_003066 [Peltaster fructicola]
MSYQPPPGPPPGYSRQQFPSNNPYKQHALNAVQQEHTRPPSSRKTEDYQPPPGPPPSHKAETYRAPPGPPPVKKSEYPPASIDDTEPPPYDPWLAVPDNALLPPPPAVMEDFSPANNASHDDALRARAWCRRNPLRTSQSWTSEALERIEEHQFTLCAQPGTIAATIQSSGPGRTSVVSTKRQGDTTLLSNLPMITPQLQPRAGEQRTIYYQVHIKKVSGDDASVALGFVAPPYPPNRLPGWHRGSLAVHNDDGRRYVNDDDGGIDFVRPFSSGVLVGIGMTFTGAQYGPAKVKVFLTRNGREEGSWDLHESRDAAAREGGIVGLDGTTDLYAAIGICGGVELEVNWAA